jgi:hypothetical protein
MGEVHKLPTAIMVPIHPTKWEAVALRHLNNHNEEVRKIAREILMTSASPYIREQAGPVVPERTFRDDLIFFAGLSALLLLVSAPVALVVRAWVL